MACDFKYLLVTHAYLTFAHSADVVPLYLLTRMIQAVGQTKAWRLSDDEKIIAAGLDFFCSLFCPVLHNQPLKPEVKQAEQKGEVEAFQTCVL